MMYRNEYEYNGRSEMTAGELAKLIVCAAWVTIAAVATFALLFVQGG